MEIAGGGGGPGGRGGVESWGGVSGKASVYRCLGGAPGGRGQKQVYGEGDNLSVSLRVASRRDTVPAASNCATKSNVK